MYYKRCKVIAEIGAVHLGSIESAIEHINQAKLSGADYAKFQKRNPHDSVPEHIKHKPHPNKDFAYGDTYLKHRLALEFSIEEHIELKKHCDSINIGYSTSVWDIASAIEVIDNINPDFIKVPSACNTNYDLLDVLYKKYSGDVHLSLGMTSADEIIDIFGYIAAYSNRTVVYQCTSEYPCPFERLFLLNIPKMISVLPKETVIGFSNHGKGIAADIAAYTLGAQWIERHFTIDRTIKHTDAAASLEPTGLYRLCRDLKNVYLALNEKTEMSEEELNQRNKLKGNW